MTQKTIVKYSGKPRFLPTSQDPVVAQFEQVHNHPNLGDSKNVTTSRIIRLEDGVIETQNTIYEPIANG